MKTCPVCQSGIAHMEKKFQKNHLEKCRKEKTKYTPTPYEVIACNNDGRKVWGIAPKGEEYCIADEIESKEQAAFIVRACNSHEALLKALKEIINIEWAQDPESRNVRDEHLKEYDRLIKKAEGK